MFFWDVSGIVRRCAVTLEGTPRGKKRKAYDLIEIVLNGIQNLSNFSKSL